MITKDLSKDNLELDHSRATYRSGNTSARAEAASVSLVDALYMLLTEQ